MPAPGTSRGSDLPDTAAVTAFTITPNDGTVFTTPTRALYVGGTGNVAVRMVDGALPIFNAVPVGAVLPISIDKVLATGTTATLMVGLA